MSSDVRPDSGAILPIPAWFALAGMLALGVLIYANSFDCSFHFDDESNILSQPAIRNFWNFSSWWNIQSTRQLGFGSFALTYLFFEYEVWGWHLFNLLIHLAAALAVWRLTALLFQTPALRAMPIAEQGPSLALAAAFLFVAHPLATQSVTYIVQRLASQAALFYLFALALYVQGRLTDFRRPGAWLSFAGAFFAGAIACLTKENAYTLPLAVLLVEIYFFQSNNIGRVFSNKRLLATAVASLALFTFFVLQNLHWLQEGVVTDLGEKITPYNYLITQFSVIWNYIRLLFIPIGLNLDHPVSLTHRFFEPRTFVGFWGLMALFGWGVWLFNRNRLVSFGILWFFLTLSVESSIVPIADLIFEHRVYLPSFGFFLALGAGVLYPLHRRLGRGATWLFVGLVATYALLTHTRNKVWKNDETLWSDVISKSPTVLAYNNRCHYYLKEGEFEKALADADRVLALSPKYLRAHLNRSAALNGLGRYDEALASSGRGVELSPEQAEIWFNRGNSFRVKNQQDSAVACYTRAIAIDPGQARFFNNRAAAYVIQNNFAAAAADFTSALERMPNKTDYLKNRYVCYVQLRDWPKAAADIERVLAIDPKYPNALQDRDFIMKKMSGK
ncbi:MAG: tetratricopeptide repeat protein [Saprospiraceae bacterium]